MSVDPAPDANDVPRRIGRRPTPLSSSEMGLATGYLRTASSGVSGVGDGDSTLSAAAVAPGVSDSGEPDPYLDWIYRLVLEAIEHKFGGVVLVGVPGTSKTYYARRVALRLAGHEDRVEYVQLHPSYQYEDFVMGFEPQPEGGFKREPKHLVRMVRLAQETDERVVLVVDELSRCDPARVFGEALTYIEGSMRGVENSFGLAGGEHLWIPSNFILIATMNEHDRGVDEVDAALARRLARIQLDPDPGILEQRILSGISNDGGLKQQVVTFFNYTLSLPPEARIGHAYFRGVDGVDSLARLWSFQLRHHFARVFLHNETAFKQVSAQWAEVCGLPTEVNVVKPKPPDDSDGASTGDAVGDVPGPPGDEEGDGDEAT